MLGLQRLERRPPDSSSFMRANCTASSARAETGPVDDDPRGSPGEP